MDGSLHNRIESQVRELKAGDIVFLSDFAGQGTQDAIRASLSRLTKKGAIKRLAHGIYYIPEIDPMLGEVRPDADKVILWLAAKEHIKVKPTGAYALHRLGLTTQVPTKRVYLTDGSPRRFKLGKMQVQFKRVPPKRLAMVGETSGLVIQAIEELGVEKIPAETKKKLRDFLLMEDSRNMHHDVALARGKVRDFIVKLLLNKGNNE
jgi:predicted transcriptional regulator of viral defense system